MPFFSLLSFLLLLLLALLLAIAIIVVIVYFISVLFGICVCVCVFVLRLPIEFVQWNGTYDQALKRLKRPHSPSSIHVECVICIYPYI